MNGVKLIAVGDVGAKVALANDETEPVPATIDDRRLAGGMAIAAGGEPIVERIEVAGEGALDAAASLGEGAAK